MRLNSLFRKTCRRVAALVALLNVGLVAPAGAQITQEVFGPGRIQYKRFDWQLYATPNFNVFFYAGGQEAARNMADFAEKELRRVSSLIGYYPYAKTTLLLYNSVADLRQSNVGLEDAHYQTGGETSLSKNRIELAFDGRQTVFRRELSFRLTKLLLQDMLYGGSLKEQLRSTYLLQLPSWFVDGAAAYVAEGWNTDMDDFIRSSVRRTPQRKLETILVRSPRLAGQSVWNYIAERYGYTSIQNVLNLTRITRDEKIGIGSSLNVPTRQFLRDWHTWYFQQNDHPPQPYAEVEVANQLQRRNRHGLLYSEPVFSPDGTRLAYVVNDRGTYRVRVRDVATGKERQLLRGGYKTPDQQVDVRMPLLAWRTNAQLAVAEVRRGLVELRLKTVSGQRSDEEGLLTRIKLAVGLKKGSSALAGFAQVLDMNYSDDGKQLVFTGVRGGQADIYLLRAGARAAEPLTNDLYDDVNPVFLKGENAIVFASNRFAADSLGTDRGTFARVADNYDLFRRSLDPDGRAPFRSLTRGISNETRPRAVAPGQVAFLSEASGIRAVWLLDTRTGQQRPITAFGENFKNFDFNGPTQNLAFVFADRSQEFVGLYPAYQVPAGLTLSKTVRQETLEDRAARASAAVTRPKVAPAVAAAADSVRKAAQVAAAADSAKAVQKVPAAAGIDTDNYEFDAEPPRARTRRNKAPVAFTPPPVPAATVLGPVPYDIRFGTTDVVTSLYADPLLATGLVGEVRMADMLENHRVRAGFFALTDFRTTNVYGEYAYLARRYDLRLGYQKASYNFLDETTGLYRFSRHVAHGSVSYPLTHSLSVRVSPSFVTTRRSIVNALTEPDEVHNFGSGTAEAVFDNSIITGLNQMEGTRVKMGVQKFKQLGGATEDFGKFYLDARHYQKLHRQIVWASRVSFGSFFGRSAKRFVLGGVDNWLNYAYQDTDTELFQQAQDHPAYLFYQQFALPMRGFPYKARTGPKHLLFNTELRLPIVQYLAGNAQIGSGFFRNLQLVGFFDAGTAYDGGNPFTRDNSYNTQVIPGPDDPPNSSPFTATVINYRDPFLYGYGAGARTTLLGFYLKYDLGWGVMDGERLKPRHYFSLGYDF